MTQANMAVDPPINREWVAWNQPGHPCWFPALQYEACADAIGHKRLRQFTG